MDMYGEIILDHFKNPKNKGLIEGADIAGEDLNPLCGDKVKISIVSKDGKVEKFGFEGEGCAISVASTSILGEKLVGMELSDLEKMENEELLEMIEVPISAGRIKCAMLGLSCIKKAIKLKNAGQ
jgi:nitrogen fixation NifU-like protein